MIFLRRAIAMIVYNDESLHLKVREELMDYLVSNRNKEWIKWLGGYDGIDEYVERYRKVKTWAESKQLILAAKLYENNFVLYDPESTTNRFVIYAADFKEVYIFVITNKH